VKNVGLSSHRNDFRFGNLKITDRVSKGMLLKDRWTYWVGDSYGEEKAKCQYR
jgi:hypothetical protein